MNKFYLIIFLVFALGVSACSSRGKGVYRHTTYSEPKSYSSDKNAHSATVDKKNYSHPTMRPYTIRGIKYYPTVVSVGDTFKGNASWYGPDFHGKLTSNGETYNMYGMTAAHKTLPMNTIVKVTNRRNGMTTVVRINDRGPFVATRIIDLSNKAAHEIDMVGRGTAPITLEILGFETKGKKKIPTKKEMKKAPQKKAIGNFALQIASFSKIAGALATQEKYDHTDGYTTIIKDVSTPKGRMFKVVLTGFKSEEEARDYKKNGIFSKAFIIRED
ncbi:septal ring lytic transglycosylase RlpA family protein [Sulfurimonas sp. SAG-AH-194-C21]|nr:septal ring lytic transglycosylase RlpA family protein [Sulfurimonas sp. SAG-AH-194-C21]MDF1883800.1 septal ring lytic transglycosylase RlpA family protein [Sulfurimonas sp. SAG-AH-194-C21]